MLRHLQIVASFLVIWLSVLFCFLDKLDQNERYHLWLLPVYSVIGFGIISLAIIIYRVSIFNDCTDAYHSLKEEIKQAREDLAAKGLTT